MARKNKKNKKANGSEEEPDALTTPEQTEVLETKPEVLEQDFETPVMSEE